MLWKLAQGVLWTHRYLIGSFWSDEDQGYIAVVPDLPGRCAFGEIQEEALREIHDAMEAWTEVCRQSGKPVPQPKAQPQKAE